VDESNEYDEQFFNNDSSVNKGIADESVVYEFNQQASSSSILAAHCVQVEPISLYLLLLDINGIFLATHYSQNSKERVPLYHTQDGLRPILLRCLFSLKVVF
jgi:hypothetical protein